MRDHRRTQFKYAAMLALALISGMLVHAVYSWLWLLVMLWLLALGQGLG